MTNFDKIGEDLFNKIRGRFPGVTIGDEEGNVTNEPETARFFDFDYKTGERTLGKVSLSISEDNGLTVIYSRDFIQNEDETTQGEWYAFLKELRKFSKKRMLDFSVRDITKSNLNKRDYQFLANRSGDDKMNESKLYGTARVSYQKVDNARLVIKHTESINTENSTSRTQKIGTIYIESADGERFKYPYKHLSGARAMARHVAEGGKPYDDFGSHITSLSEELNKLRKFKTYMGRSSVMAESLAGYMDIVRERIGTVKKTIDSLQKPNYYQETFGNFVKPVFEEVPGDVAENWIDELTIKQFNEELSDVFPYIYNLVKEGTKAKALGPDDLEEAVAKIACTECDEVSTAAAWKKNNNFCPKCKTSNKGVAESREEFELEQAFEDSMGQFADHVCEDCGNPSWRTFTESEKQKGLDGKACWKGYRRQGTKMKGGKRVDNCVKVSEAGDANFTPDDLRQLQKMNNVDEVKRRAIELITTNSRKPMKPEKVAWFKRQIAGKRTPMDVIKLMYDLMLSGDGQAVIGSRGSTAKNSYRQKFSDDLGENNPFDYDDDKIDAVVAQSVEEIKDMVKNDQKIAAYLKDFRDEAIANGAEGSLEDVADDIADLSLEIARYSLSGQDSSDSAESALPDVTRYTRNILAKAYKEMLGKFSEQGELEKKKTPLGEFILSYFDRQSGQFPKGETAVLTMIEKDYGEEFIEPAKAFIEQINNLVAERYGFREPDIQEDNYELEDISRLAGLR